MIIGEPVAGLGHSWLAIAIAIAVAWIGILYLLQLYARPRSTQWTLEDHRDENRRLVVLVHGRPGVKSFGSAIDIAREALPGSDLLVFDFDGRQFSNADPFEIANTIELQVHKAHQSHKYDEIVLMGHSVGGVFLRKALVWGNGIEEDRTDFDQHGMREWVAKVSRFVSLASINRGWAIWPKPKHMSLPTLAGIWMGVVFGRLTGTGRLILAVRRGSPFIADSRVQWIDMCRRNSEPRPRVPQTIALLGDHDDVVSRQDGMDLIAAKDTVFKTISDTGHREIGTALAGGTSKGDQERRKIVWHALRGEIELLDPGHNDELEEDATITRIVYILHGIRDYGEWTDCLRARVEQDPQAKLAGLRAVNFKYGWFPMLPFLLFGDRQKKVRMFMDEYTENRARFPNATTFDYIGHSNGTYVLAGALQRYSTLTVDRVYFAGSVVPKHYTWLQLIECGRVKHVANVVAAGDWVVALFPRFFEQIADWRGTQPVRGFLDIGSAGFRGFEEASDAEKRVENVQFATGSHGTGVDVANVGKIDAIIRYIVSNDTGGFSEFRNVDGPVGWLSFMSNICWLIWLALIGIVLELGVLAFHVSTLAGWLYILVIVGLLNSV